MSSSFSDLLRFGAYGTVGAFMGGSAFGALAATKTGRGWIASTGRWSFKKAIPRVLSGAWIASNYVRLFAPLSSGGTGIGFGAAAGGVGVGTLAGAATGGYLAGAAAGTAITYGIWGEKGAREALGFYTGGAVGSSPDYAGYFDIPGNLKTVLLPPEAASQRRADWLYDNITDPLFVSKGWMRHF